VFSARGCTSVAESPVHCEVVLLLLISVPRKSVVDLDKQAPSCRAT